MAISPQVYNKIKRVVFTNNEPSTTDVLWAKPTPSGEFVFSFFNDGEWQQTSDTGIIVISNIGGEVSTFINDVPYLTSRNLQGYATERWVMNQHYLTSHQPLDTYVNAGGYNSIEKVIELKHGTNVVATIDAKPFIKDGMVDSVVIRDNNLVITFNVDSGKEDITIPLSEIFNPSDYYTKNAIDLKLVDYALVTDIPSLVGYATESWVNSQGFLKEHQSLEAYALKTELFSGDYNDLSNKPVIPVVPSNVSAFTNDAGYLTQHQDISGKANIGSVGDSKDANTIYGSKAYADYVLSLRKTDSIYIGGGKADDDFDMTPVTISQLEETPVELLLDSDYIYVVYPKNRGMVASMCGIDIPMHLIDETTIEGRDYYIYKSQNDYTGNLKVGLLLKY